MPSRPHAAALLFPSPSMLLLLAALALLALPTSPSSPSLASLSALAFVVRVQQSTSASLLAAVLALCRPLRTRTMMRGPCPLELILSMLLIASLLSAPPRSMALNIVSAGCTMVALLLGNPLLLFKTRLPLMPGSCGLLAPLR